MSREVILYFSTRYLSNLLVKATVFMLQKSPGFLLKSVKRLLQSSENLSLVLVHHHYLVIRYHSFGQSIVADDENEYEEIIDEIKDINLNNITPMEAMLKLKEIQDKVK